MGVFVSIYIQADLYFCFNFNLCLFHIFISYSIFLFVLRTWMVMLGSVGCVPVNYVHRQPALFLHKVILTIYLPDLILRHINYFFSLLVLLPSVFLIFGSPLLPESNLDNLPSRFNSKTYQFFLSFSCWYFTISISNIW